MTNIDKILIKQRKIISIDKKTYKSEFKVNNNENNYYFLGYSNDTISDKLCEKGHWEQEYINIAETFLKDNSVIFDIGANIGVWSIKLAKKNRKIYAFEPFVPSYNALCGNIFINQKEKNITTFNYACTDDLNEKYDFIIKEPNNIGNATIIKNNNNSVKLMRLDELNINKLDLIKIDVEGHELQALKGGEELIKKYKPKIIFESWGEEKYKEKRKKLMDYIESFGYTIKLIGGGTDDFIAEILN